MKLKLILMLLMTSLLGGCLFDKSPTGRHQALLYSEQDMAAMGRTSFEQMINTQQVNRNPAVNAYVNCITQRIINVLPGPKLHWQVVVFDSPQVNAFALPGGYIGVYTGLLSVANTPDQLATVLAHEVAHVLAQHGNEQVSRAQATDWGLKLTDWALGQAETEHRQLVMAALGLGAEYGVILPFGRAQETEADVMGLTLMAKAGFNPKASIALWHNMAKASGGANPPELLSTHPSNDSRIEELTKLQREAEPLYRQSMKQGLPQCRLGR